MNLSILYPPFNTNLTIDEDADKDFVINEDALNMISLIDTNGRVLYRATATDNTHAIENIASGFYTLLISDKGGKTNTALKLVK